MTLSRLSFLTRLMASMAIFCLLISGSLLLAAPPAGYYNSAEGLAGNNLRVALRNIISGHNSLSYNAAKDALWANVDNRGGFVVDMYSGRTSTNLNPDTNGMNTEHTWPQSRGAGSVPARSDLHHLFIVDSTWNSRRGSFVFANVTNPSNSNAFGAKFNSQQGFEVPNEYKGDIARAIFYFHVRYNLPVNDTGPLIGNNNSTADNNMGRLTTLIQWHQNDPVSSFETTRNDRIFAIQSNRNPFIDRPEFVELMFEIGPPAPAIVLSTDPANPENTEAVTLVAQISSVVTVDPATVRGYWRIGSAGGFTEVAMTRTSGTNNNGTWRSTSTIPPQPGGTRVEYYAQASDTDGTSTRQPAAGQQFYISFEPGAPAVAARTFPEAPVEGDAIRIEAQVSADSPVAAGMVSATYETTTGLSGTLPMSRISGTSTNGLWRTTATIDGLMEDDELEFSVTATDDGGRSTTDPPFGFHTVTVGPIPTFADLSGWKLIDTDAGTEVVFPNGTQIARGGTVIVARQGSKSQFEAFWGALPTNAVYIDSFALIGGNGLVINGGEVFELRDASNALVSGPTPSTLSPSNARVYRTSTTANSWERSTDTETADPGVVDLPGGGAGVILTEYCDPAGAFEEAFVEIFFDPPAVPAATNFSTNRVKGHAPLTVQFSDTTTGGTPNSWQWDFDNNGSTDSTQANPTHTFNTPGVYSVRLTTNLGTLTKTDLITAYSSRQKIITDIISNTPVELDDANEDGVVDSADLRDPQAAR